MLIRPPDLGMSLHLQVCYDLVLAVRSGVSPEPMSNIVLEQAVASCIVTPLSASTFSEQCLNLYGIVQNLSTVLSGALYVQAVQVQDLLWASVFSASIAPFTSGRGGLSGGAGASGSWAAVPFESPPCTYSLPVIPHDKFLLSGKVQYWHTEWSYGPGSIRAELDTNDRGSMCSLGWRVAFWRSVLSLEDYGNSWGWLDVLPHYYGALCPRCMVIHGDSWESVVDLPISGGLLVQGGPYVGMFLFPHFCCIELSDTDYPPSGFTGISEVFGGWGAGLAWYGVAKDFPLGSL